MRYYNFVLLLLLFIQPLFADYPEISRLHSLQDIYFQEHQDDLERLSPLLMGWENRKGDPELKEQILSHLRLYQYRVNEGENLYTIAADLMLNPDTLASLNGVEHPLFLQPGTQLVIPNLSGLYIRNEGLNQLDDRLKRTGRTSHYGLSLKVLDQNGLSDFTYYPGDKFTPEERLFFVSRPFHSPLRNFSLGSPFGFRSDPFTGRWVQHQGIDLNVPIGTETFSIGEGKVKETGVLEKYGIYIIIIHNGGYESLYGHLDQVLCKTGDTVQTGQIIAYSGNSGRSTGPHLHLEIRRNGTAVDPMDLISSP